MKQVREVALLGGMGKGSDFGEQLVLRLRQAGYQVAVFLRTPLEGVLPGDVLQFQVDMTQEELVRKRIDELEAETGPITAYIHNAASIVRGSFTECQPSDFEKVWRDTFYTAVTVCGPLVSHMLTRKQGAIIFTGATASIRGGAAFTPFASARFALRGLSQSMARELGPQGIHVAHVILDGLISGQRAQESFKVPEEVCMNPGDLAEAYLNIIRQPSSCWTQELDLRPYMEKF